MTTKPQPQVLILGGGFAGPLLAIVLKGRGITSEVYELRDEGAQQGGNIALAPNALRVLDIAGVYDKIRRTGFNYEQLYLLNHHGAELGQFRNGSQKDYNYPAVRIHRREVRNFLLERLKDLDIPIHYKVKFTHVVSETDQNVTVAFDDGSERTADFVVGCDGIHSKVRHYCWPESVPIWQGAMGMMGTVFADQLEDRLGPVGQQDLKKWPSHLPSMLFGDAGMFGTMPADFAGTEFGFFTTQKTQARSREEWGELEKDKAQLKSLMESAFLVEKGGADYPQEVRMLVERAKPETLSVWPFYVVPETPRWFSEKGRVIFLGDSAHAIPPTGGQGAAQAFEDAVTLGLTLKRIYEPNPMPDVHTGATQSSAIEMLTRWCNHRKERVKKVHDFTSRNGELMKSSPMWVQQAAKEWVIWASMKASGPRSGMEWLYQYHCENVLAALAG